MMKFGVSSHSEYEIQQRKQREKEFVIEADAGTRILAKWQWLGTYGGVEVFGHRLASGYMVEADGGRCVLVIRFNYIWEFLEIGSVNACEARAKYDFENSYLLTMRSIEEGPRLCRLLRMTHKPRTALFWLNSLIDGLFPDRGKFIEAGWDWVYPERKLGPPPRMEQDDA